MHVTAHTDDAPCVTIAPGDALHGGYASPYTIDITSPDVARQLAADILAAVAEAWPDAEQVED